MSTGVPDHVGRGSRGRAAMPAALADPCGLRAGLRGVPRSAIASLTDVAPGLVDRITARVQREIPAYAGPPHGRRERMIREAVGRAIVDFLDLVAARPGDHLAVDALFHGIGHGLALEGHEPGLMLAALQLASGDVWFAIGRAMRRRALSGSTVAALGTALTDYLRHLSDQVQRGFLAARSAAHEPRARLVRALVDGERAAVLDELARTAGWRLPERVVVLVADVGGQPARPGLIDLDGRALAAFDRDRLVVVVAEQDAAGVRSALPGAVPGVPVAVSWAVPVSVAPHARRWAQRALWMRRHGRIPREPLVIDCADHRLALWLEADPPLAEQVSAELLAPLLAPGRRPPLAMAETLLRWLETNESAVAMAAHLEVHPQTVRRHIHRLRALYGARLADPEQRIGLILALGTVLPEWRAAWRRRGH